MEGPPDLARKDKKDHVAEHDQLQKDYEKKKEDWRRGGG